MSAKRLNEPSAVQAAASIMGRKGGSKTSEAKRKACARNWKKALESQRKKREALANNN